MIIDSSALVAILFREPMAERLLVALENAQVASAGAPTLSEAGIVVGARLGFASRDLAQLLAHFEVQVIPFGPLHNEEAQRAYEKFGKGRHKAALNFGDCLTYAVARLAQEPLLCVGDDFSHTDLTLADY